MSMLRRLRIPALLVLAVSTAALPSATADAGCFQLRVDFANGLLIIVNEDRVAPAGWFEGRAAHVTTTGLYLACLGIEDPVYQEDRGSPLAWPVPPVGTGTNVALQRHIGSGNCIEIQLTVAACLGGGQAVTPDVFVFAASGDNAPQDGCNMISMEEAMDVIEVTFEVSSHLTCFLNSGWNPGGTQSSGAILDDLDAFVGPIGGDIYAFGWVEVADNNGIAFQPGHTSVGAETAQSWWEYPPDWPHRSIALHELGDNFNADHYTLCDGYGVMDYCDAFLGSTDYDQAGYDRIWATLHP